MNTSSSSDTSQQQQDNAAGSSSTSVGANGKKRDRPADHVATQPNKTAKKTLTPAVIELDFDLGFDMGDLELFSQVSALTLF